MQVADRDRLLVARLDKRYSQRELGFLCGVSQTTISFIENGQLISISLELALSLRDWLKLPLEDVVVIPTGFVVPETTTPADPTSDAEAGR